MICLPQQMNAVMLAPGRSRRGRLARRVIWSLLCAAGTGHAATDVLVNSYDNLRTGANLSESTLTVSNVGPETFGRLYSYAVDGTVQSQPLIASGVSLPNGSVRNVVYVTTLNNSVYAFDADRGGAPLWHKSLISLPDGSAASPTGIYSTPVIDRGSHTIYVVAGLMQGSQPSFVLHALDLADASEKASGPVVIAGAARIASTLVHFEPTSTRIAVQRAALALARGKLIVAFGGDYFEGWVFSYDAADLRAAPSAFCTTCVSRIAAISGIDYLNTDCTFLGPGGGIWQAGRGPVVDDKGTVYFFTGNKAHIIKQGCTIPRNDSACAACSSAGGCACKGVGSPKVCRGPDTCTANQSADGRSFDVNEALIGLDPARGLALTGWFRPANWSESGSEGLEMNDLDLGSSGPVLIPGTTRLIGGGKQGVLYTLDITASASCIPSLTNTCISPSQPNPVQSFRVSPAPPPPNEYYRHLYGGPVIWARPQEQGGTLAYVWRENDHLRSYSIGDQFIGCNTDNPAPTTSHNCASSAQSEDLIDHHPGGILALSGNGADPASAIVWASTTRVLNGPGKLMAFKALPERGAADSLAKIWDSDLCEEDRLEAGSDFVPPTVANGKVYLATQADKVEVFGLVRGKTCTATPLPSLGPMLQ